jgi:hypothetical protein
MKRLFIGNFHFEQTLCHSAGITLPSSLQRLNDELACAWIPVTELGDAVWVPKSIEPEYFNQLAASGLPRVTPISARNDLQEKFELCPWGWNSEIQDSSALHYAEFSAPPLESVRQVNSRRFSFQQEQHENVELPGSAMIQSLDQLDDILRNQKDDRQSWVLKAEFSMSARERLLGIGRSMSVPDRNWASKRLKRESVLFFEPWVQRIAEVGLQFDIPISEPPELLGITPLLADSHGRYCGSGFDTEAASNQNWKSAIDIAKRACEEMQSRGYFGPVGIDAVRYLDDYGEEQIRPLQDINARWTMGRLSLGLRRLLKPDESGIWWHTRWPTENSDAPRAAYQQFENMLPPQIHAIRTSPFSVNGQPVAYATIALIGESGFSVADWVKQHLAE